MPRAPWTAALLILGLATSRAQADAPEPADPPAVATDTRSTPPSDPWMESLRRAAEALEWSDQLVRHDWRLQRRPGSDAWRVLDSRDHVQSAGSEESCRTAFTALQTEGTIPAVNGSTVLLLHGLGEGRGSMRPLAAYLRQHHDATVMCFGYASPRTGIDDHARSLASVIDGLPETEQISFVAHSLGNIVVRRWMAAAPEGDRRRLHRMVMLGAPNQGSELARKLSQIWLLTTLSRGAARELVLDWPRVAREIVVPACPFGIIAGGLGDGRGYSPLIDGDDDAVVGVDETHLDGADDFLLLPVRHAFMMRDPAVQQATATFLETGRFAVEDAPTFDAAAKP